MFRLADHPGGQFMSRGLFNNNMYMHDERTDFDFGPEGIFGAEYTFEDVPVTLFAETSLQLELVDRLTLRLFAGTGARFNF
jgi:hypothetical protein